MTDKETSRQQVTAIVEKFRNTPASAREKYTEQETRLYFILPLFRALGWDTESPSEFSAEEQISRGFVDFGFYLNSVPAFYLETKKASEKLEKPQFMKQAINYSFLKGVTWAVLTDFEQLMVFNAEWEETDPTKARFLNLEYERYATDQFDDLWLLSKTAFLTREIDRVAERFGKKSIKQPVTEVLFKQLTKWRRDLFTQMRTYGQTLWSTDSRAVDNAVQKFLDRMIFIRTVEDRGVEPNQLRSLIRQSKAKDFYPKLLKLFRDLDAVYNSNLFAESDTDRMEVHDPDLIEEIIEGLYGDQKGFVNYDFNAITADVLGAVYEQYLGFKAQDPKGEQSLDPRKQEKRKKQGIYYTPQFVVRYIVRQTLGKLLESGVDAHSLRILDPACGSGSFLIEAFDVLDRWLAINGNETDRKFPRQRRMRILKENIYGVDLDEQAVEVTRLNLMLRAAIERDKLPLLTHIQYGNSLIDDAEIAGSSAFKWEERFGDVMSSGGFDVVIGNPPYIRAESMPKNERLHYQLSGKYDVVYGRFDIFVLFMGKGIDLLKKDEGKLGFIVPSAILSQNYAKLLRQKILHQCSVDVIVDCSDYRIFQDAAVATTIICLDKTKCETDSHKIEVVKQVTYNKGINPDEKEVFHIDQATFRDTANNMFRLELIGNTNQLVIKLKQELLRIGDICTVITGVVAHDSKTGASKDRLINKKIISTFSKPYVEAKEFADTRYSEVKPHRYIEYIPSEMHRPKFPELFESPKLLIQDIIGKSGLLATYDDSGVYTNHSFNCCVQKHHLLRVNNQRLSITEKEAAISQPYSALYILGIVNSALISFYFRSALGGKMHASPESIREIPIHKVDFDIHIEKNHHDQLVILVEKMLRLKQDHAAAEAILSDDRHRLAEEIAQTDNKIDQLVYQLYDLTPEEIGLVEGDWSKRFSQR